MIYWVLGLVKLQEVVLVLEKSPFSTGMRLLSKYQYELQISVGLLVRAGFAQGLASPGLLHHSCWVPELLLPCQVPTSPLRDGICLIKTF